MHFAMSLDGENCASCGEEDLVYWIEDETEDTIEAYMNCRGCRREYPTLFISKDKDTSDAAVRERLVDRHL